MRLTAGCFDKLNMTIWRFLNLTTSHQADNLAKLRQEFLSVIELIAKIFGAVSRTISLMRLSALLASKRCRCRNDGFCSDEEQGNTHPKQNPTYMQYVILERMGVVRNEVTE